MNVDPLSTALTEIAETKHLLEQLITSSESFDYVKAKSVLTELNRKVRALGKLQSKYQRWLRPGTGRGLAERGNICVVDFKASFKGSTAAGAGSSQP